jgi:lysophospholipase L1-like esterase
VSSCVLRCWEMKSVQESGITIWPEAGISLAILTIALCAGAMVIYAGVHPVAAVSLWASGSCFALAAGGFKAKPLMIVGGLAAIPSLLLPIRLLFGADAEFAASLPKILCAVYAWVVFLIVLPLLRKTSARQVSVLAIVAGLTIACLWLGTAYLEALRVGFYLGLLPAVWLITLLKQWILRSVPAIQTANTCILLLVGVPLADLFWRPAPLGPAPEIRQKFYSYEMARKDPVRFERWWQFFTHHSNGMLKNVLREDTRRLAPARTIPGSEANLFESVVTINTLGFRGPEVAAEKEDVYRIVALGESTTFGFTMEQHDEPWPEVLERLLRERSGFSRKIEVINAGLPGFTVRDNLRRLPADIAPIKPDMILSYHGYNGFQFLSDALPAPVAKQVPVLRPRALRLLEQAEYRAKVLLFRRAQAPSTALEGLALLPLETELALEYRRLHTIAKEQDVTLVLGTFSMAVNSHSDPEVVDFYQLGFPAVAWSIQANLCHNELIRSLVRAHPEIVFADTQPGLDGCHENFIDLVHLTQAGRNKIAEAFYSAILPVLQKELGAGSSLSQL